MSDGRLSRMETKLDKLSEAVVEMARMEDRLHAPLSLFFRLQLNSYSTILGCLPNREASSPMFFWDNVLSVVGRPIG